MRRALCCRSGVTAVEFALLAPVFMVLVMGMTAYGIYFGASHSVQQIAADSARSALAGLTQTERQSLATTFVQKNAGGYAFIDGHSVAVETHDSSADGNQFVVTISYDASNLPIWRIFAGLPLPDAMIRRQSTIRVGGI